jgi:hypothetical protein
MIGDINMIQIIQDRLGQANSPLSSNWNGLYKMVTAPRTPFFHTARHRALTLESAPNRQLDEERLRHLPSHERTPK